MIQNPTLADCRLIALPEFRDARGTLIPMETASGLPFVPVRAFTLRDVAPGASRGEHAHRVSDEFVIPLAGAVSVELFDGRESRTWRLASPREGLYLPPMIWIELSEFSSDAVVLALASRAYDASEYVRNRASYVQERLGQ